VIASMQPTHCTSDKKWVVERIGQTRARYAYAWRAMLENKVRLAFGSDAPVESINPWPGVFAAVTRQDKNFEPAGGFFPEAKISLKEALTAFTEGAAFAAFNEKSLGKLEPGFWADFITLDQNPFASSTADLYDLKVQATYLGGTRVYP